MRSTVIGLTGQSGSGKTFLGSVFSEKGIPSIDADVVSHRVMGEDPACLRAIREAFGDAVFDGDRLDRKKLGALVFSAPERLELLGRTVFPFITREIEKELSRTDAPLVLLDAPTLYEAGAERLCDYVVAVCAPFEKRLERVMSRDGLTREEALLRLTAQKDDAFYEKRADLVIHNDGTLESFFGKAARLAELLIRRYVTPEENKEESNHE